MRDEEIPIPKAFALKTNLANDAGKVGISSGLEGEASASDCKGGL